MKKNLFSKVLYRLSLGETIYINLNNITTITFDGSHFIIKTNNYTDCFEVNQETGEDILRAMRKL